MAGDTKETGPAELANPYAGDPFPGIQASLDAIRDELRGSIAEGPAIFDIEAAGLVAFATAMWQRLRVTTLVVSASAAGTVTLAIGSTLRTWNVAAGVSEIALPAVIERGTNVDLGGTAVGLAGYLIATPE